MKLRNKIAAITAAAMLAFTGVGFAAWTFTKSVEADLTGITGKVTAAIEANELKVQDGNGNDVAGLYLICDAPSGQTDLVAGNGIYWSTEADGKDDLGAKSEITALTLIGSVTEDDNDIADIAKYVGHFEMTSVAATTGTWVNIAAASLDTTVESTSKNADVEYVWNLPALSYASVPASVEEVNSLETEVNALNLTFSFSFNVESVIAA